MSKNDNNVASVNNSSTATQNKKKVNIMNTDYGREVLGVNHDLKKATKTIGGARAILLNFHTEGILKLEPYQLAILKASKKKQPVYEALKKLTRVHKKTGNTCPFYLLQTMFNKDKRSKIEAIIKANK